MTELDRITQALEEVKAAGSFEEATAIMDKYFKEETEIDRLEAQLKARDIAYEKCPLNGGWQICVPSRKLKEWDVVCHSFSYGHEQGLLELMGDSMLTYDELKYDTVVGYLEAEDVLYRHDHRDQIARDKLQHKDLLSWWNSLDLAEQEELKKHWDRVVTEIENRRE